MQYRRIFSLFACFVFFGWNLLFFQQGCGSNTPEVLNCQSDLDCPGRKVCQKKKCIYQLEVKVSTDEPQLDKHMTERQMERTHEASKEKKDEIVVHEEEPMIPEDAGSTTPELDSENKPELDSENKPEVIPEPICKNGDKKPCSHSCGKGVQVCNANRWEKCVPLATTRSCGVSKGECKVGKQTCTNGKWGKCIGEVKPAKEICDNKDNDCNGKVDEIGCVCFNGKTQSCGVSKGECKAGKQTCTNGKWGTCVGEVKPKKELCDGKDNDCDGVIDNNFPTLTKTCYVGRGECKRQGKYICRKDYTGTVCSVKAGLPTTEICDNKDNDCDGYIDESVSKYCYPKTTGCYLYKEKYICRGSCRAGKQTCSRGLWGKCYAYKTPQVELCRNGQDDDCDGKIDETCGLRWPHLVADSKGNAIPYKKPLPGFPAPVSRLKTGLYKIPSFNHTACLSRPLILTAHSTSIIPISYQCSNKYEYSVSTGAARTTTGTPGDSGFSAVALQVATGETWGQILYKSCRSTSPYQCYPSSSYGGASVTKVSTGTFLIKHPNCNTVNRPYFSTIYASSVSYSGYTAMRYYKSGYCRVYTYDLKGNLADRSFVYWIPNTANFSWATIDSYGKIAASYNFKDQYTKWYASYKSGQYLDISYSGFAKPSAVFATSSRFGGFHPIVYPLYLGIKMPRIIPVTLTGKFQMHSFSILFMQ